MSSVAHIPAAPALASTLRSHRVISFTFQPAKDERIEDVCRRIGRELSEVSATPLHLLFLGDCRAQPAAMDAVAKFLPDTPWTWAQGAACDGRAIAGIQIHAFTGNVDRFAIGGRVAASVFNDGGARQCFVGGMSPADRTLSRPEQTREVIEDLQKILALAGFDVADTIRTWFFLEKILSWYGDFNIARTKSYAGVKFRTGSLPASTGVGAPNPSGAALALAAWAFRPVEKNSYAEEVASPLQCPAPAYGSSFSRAMEISATGGRRLLISGTASIALGGKTLWTGDTRKQMETTMEVVEAILRARQFDFSNITRATAYFRNMADAPVFSAWLAKNNLAAMPLVSAQCDICRDDLLFELEAEAETGS
jgi:enamine deaminase RidA (YjgF/YER057c/UK114 family)